MTMRILLILAFCAVAFSAFAAQGVDGDMNQVEIAVPAHDIARGTIIGDGDFVTKAIPALRAGDGFVRSLADVDGKETRRALRAGEFVRASDLKRPTVVPKGSTVTMVFEAPGLRLTALGRALAEGGEGDTITVLNPTSYRKVEAVVIAAGTVRVIGLSAAGARPARDLAAAQR
jgi:flagella basal body P-ring formation protein FlgA